MRWRRAGRGSWRSCRSSRGRRWLTAYVFNTRVSPTRGVKGARVGEGGGGSLIVVWLLGRDREACGEVRRPLPGVDRG